MSALFERAQKTKIMITSVPVTADEMASATWLELSCTIKQASFTAGQKKRY
ncbi:tail protein [Klebsiella pneumoniae]|uniref:Tail protein n=1 Tax=Klebsiella pneumoniae TaxID=573 RepID=A0A447RK65_KLEPN|nr:tail protein [Klebsiella pneumoniae]